MHYADALKRGVATFVAGATASPIVAAAFGISTVKAAGIAGVIAVVNLAGRTAQAYLAKNP